MRRRATQLVIVTVVAALALVSIVGTGCAKAYGGCVQNGFFDADDPPGIACSLNYSCQSGEVDLRLSCADAAADGTHVCSCVDNGVEIGAFEDEGICDDVDGARGRFEAGCGIQIYERLGIFTISLQ